MKLKVFEPKNLTWLDRLVWNFHSDLSYVFVFEYWRLGSNKAKLVQYICVIISCDSILTFLQYNPVHMITSRTGCFRKNFTLGISIIFPVINMLEGYGIFHLKGGIHSSVLSTKTFFYDIRNLRYKLIKMENQIWKILDIGQY